jgi:hypothetical protein
MKNKYSCVDSRSELASMCMFFILLVVIYHHQKDVAK